MSSPTQRAIEANERLRSAISACNTAWSYPTGQYDPHQEENELLNAAVEAVGSMDGLLRSHPAAPQQGEGDPVAPSIRALAAQEAIRVRNCISILRDRFPDPSPFAQFVGEELDTMARNILALGTRPAPEPSGISGQLDDRAKSLSSSPGVPKEPMVDAVREMFEQKYRRNGKRPNEAEVYALLLRYAAPSKEHIGKLVDGMTDQEIEHIADKESGGPIKTLNTPFENGLYLGWKRALRYMRDSFSSAPKEPASSPEGATDGE